MTETHITVSQWSEQAFRDGAVPWGELLARSAADPLFLSWDWLHEWWDAHADPQGLQLRIFAASAGDRLVGIAPLVLGHSTTRAGTVSSRYQWLGQLFRVPGSAMSEHMDFVVDRGLEDKVGTALMNAILADPEWDELIMGNVLLDHSIVGAMMDQMRSASRYFRITEGMMSYCVACDGSFDDFAARLGAGTRSRLLGGRKRLAARGEVLEKLYKQGQTDEFFEIFDELHRLRWGWSTFAGYRGAFYRGWLERMAEREVAVLSVLAWQGHPISAMVDIRLGDREYAFQSAFRNPEMKRISPGLIHLGLRIEDAFGSGLNAFELLGGSGKNEDFKSRLGAVERRLATLHAVRSPFLANLHRGYDWLKRIRS